MKVPADSVSGEGPLPGVQTAVFSLYLHVAERGAALLSPSYYEDTDPILGAHPPDLI